MNQSLIIGRIVNDPELKETENLLISRENNLDKREEMLQKRDSSLDAKENSLNLRNQTIQEKEDKMDTLLKEEIEKLEKISGLSKDNARKQIMSRVEADMSKEIAEYLSEQAKDYLLKTVEEEVKHETAKLIKENEARVKEESEKRAKDIIVNAIQKCSADHVSETTISVVNLPNDEMKGRLIGREGRNIRTIESITGVDLIIDDTPEAIVISSFDPLRREIAKITIETLIKDGRIHPARIEEVYDKTVRDIDSKITELGNKTMNELGLTKMDPELLHLIGKLNYRTSYGQNALKHSIEVANLCGLMASELGENISLAKRAGLLHDIGKAIDFEVEGSHVDIGYDIAKKYHENETVLDAIVSHHGAKEAKTVIANLVAVADTLSAARPGARNDSVENYIKRLEQLESIGNSFEGVEKTYAMQAGREVRVMVKPNEVDDLTSFKIARDMKDKIEKEMQYPGTIKITVIRETRAQEEAK